jgi:hypothetical protein
MRKEAMRMVPREAQIKKVEGPRQWGTIATLVRLNEARPHFQASRYAAFAHSG